MSAAFQKGEKRGFRKAGSNRFGAGAVPLLSLSQTLQQAKLEFSRARRYGYPLTLGICQIDRIDSLADLYGQESRQLLFEQVARLFRARARSTDLLGRLGEDRLLWVLPHTELLGARIAADRLREGVEALELRSGQRSIRITLSAGLACFVNRNTLFFDSVLVQAEKALERAQGRGGNLIEEHPLSLSKGAGATGSSGSQPERRGRGPTGTESSRDPE